MVKVKPLVLIVDDRYQCFQSLSRLISPETFSVIWVPDEHEGVEVLKDQRRNVRIIIVDLKSSRMGGGGFLYQVREMVPEAALLITAPLGPFLYQKGAFYDLSGPNLKQGINAVLLSILERMDAGLKPYESQTPQPECRERFGVIIGGSKAINQIYHLIENLMDSSATVMIQGESGTGKELVAQTIHQTSSRSDRPFVAINCGAIPANLMESELFGHERGAFTTAIHQRKGKFEAAQGGTLFLDEIGELGRELQVKFLRVLQEREFQRVGGNRSHKTDVRIIAATSQDLKGAVAKGHFRDDLFYRLNVVPIHIPPLRERREDIPILLDHFFHKICGKLERTVPVITKEARTLLLAYSYPGNVRELTNIVERLMVICPNGKITSKNLPEEMRSEEDPKQGVIGKLTELPEGGVPLCEVEKELILKTLKMTSWNKAAAARMLGITRRLLYLRLSQYGLSIP